MLILCISENSHISIVVNREMIILYYFLVLPFIQNRLLIMNSDSKLARRNFRHEQNQGLGHRDYFWVEEKSHRYKCMHMKNRMETQTVPEHSKITITCTRGCIKMKRVSGPISLHSKNFINSTVKVNYGCSSQENRLRISKHVQKRKAVEECDNQESCTIRATDSWFGVSENCDGDKTLLLNY